MRVLYASTIPRGGPLTHLRQLAPRVAAEGVDVHVLCANGEVAESFRALGVPADAVAVAHKLDLTGAAGLWPHLRHVDLIHTHDRRAGLFGRVEGRLRGVKVVHTLHGMPEEIAVRIGREGAPVPPGVSRARIAWLLQGYMRIEATLTRLGHVIAPSRAMGDFMLAHGFPRKRLHVIPYGIDLPPAVPPPEHEVLVVGAAANLEHWKGIDLLLEAAMLATSPLRLEIYGTGSLQDELERRASDAGLDATFHGFVSDMSRRLRDLDVLVQPSRADNLPLAMLEAMAAGLPVIGARVGGIPELLADGESGIVVEPEDPAALASALDALAVDPARRAELGKKARQRIAAHFSADDVARQTVALYRRLCASST